MKYCVYSVRDKYVGYGRPFYVQDNGRADQVAIRTVKEAYKRGVFEETAIDCTLFKIGSFDDKTASHENYRFPEELLNIADLMKGEENGEISETL